MQKEKLGDILFLFFQEIISFCFSCKEKSVIFPHKKGEENNLKKFDNIILRKYVVIIQKSKTKTLLFSNSVLTLFMFYCSPIFKKVIQKIQKKIIFIRKNWFMCHKMYSAIGGHQFQKYYFYVKKRRNFCILTSL